jgi:hypothetical protein
MLPLAKIMIPGPMTGALPNLQPPNTTASVSETFPHTSLMAGYGKESVYQK